MCFGIFNNQIKQGLSLSPPEKTFLNRYIFGRGTDKKVDGAVHFFRLVTVWWPGAQSVRDSHLLAGNFTKYSPILIFFHWQTQQ